jgi:hypothetical protein
LGSKATVTGSRRQMTPTWAWQATSIRRTSVAHGVWPSACWSGSSDLTTQFPWWALHQWAGSNRVDSVAKERAMASRNGSRTVTYCSGSMTRRAMRQNRDTIDPCGAVQPDRWRSMKHDPGQNTTCGDYQARAGAYWLSACRSQCSTTTTPTHEMVGVRKEERCCVLAPWA